MNDNDAQQHPPHAYEQSLVGWIVGAAQLECQMHRDASTHLPPLQALAHRVNWVLMAFHNNEHLAPHHQCHQHHQCRTGQ